jgi:hypothetical protein
MPAWPGGPCPECGEHMPLNLIHCQNCRHLLNSDLEADSVEIPEFIPLQEIEDMLEVSPAGFFFGCPHCQRELRINGKYCGQRVKCKFCEAPFDLDLNNPRIEKVAFFADCPHCQVELRSSWKYLDTKVACKHCNGKLHFVESTT